MAGNVAGGGFTYVADADSEEDALEGYFPGFLQTLQKALDALFLPAFELEQLRAGEGIQVGRGVHQVEVVELLHGGFSGEDVHGFAGQKMQDAALDLGGASGRVGAEPAGFAFGLYERRTAVGTYLGELRLLGSGFALGLFHTRDLGDDFTALLHVHPVSFVDVQGTDLVFVHQRGTLYHGAAQEYGLQVGDGSDGAGSAHLVVDG